MRAKTKQHIQQFLLTAAAIFIVMQLFSFIVLQTPNITTLNAWDGVTSETPQDGVGSQQDPYIISTAEHLKWLSAENNSGNFSTATYFKLGDHINLEDHEWVPIGTVTNPFIGSFDGDDYTISNLNLKESTLVFTYSGLFGYTQNATIKNVKLSQVDFLIDYTNTTEVAYVGALVGYSYNTTIDRIVNGGTIQLISATELVYAGGIAGYINDGSVSKAVNNIGLSMVSVEDAIVGGLVGRLTSASMSASYNKQTLNITTTSRLMVGGLIGELYNSDLQKVFNEGIITGKSEQVWVGGIAGLVSSGPESASYTQTLMYNTKKVTLNATQELQPNLYAGGLFGQVQEKNTVSYAYTLEEVTTHLESVGTTTNMGSLIGSLSLGANLEHSYYNVAYEAGEDGVGASLGTISEVYYATLANMRSRATFSGQEWTFGTNTNSNWLITGNINNGYPALIYVGNYSIHAQVYGGGSVSPTGTSFYSLGISPIYNLTSNAGYQIQKVIYENEEDTSFNGSSSEVFNAFNISMPIKQNAAKNFAVIFEPIPFVKTQMFIYLISVGSIIIIMIVGTFIINYRYATKMEKIMSEKKKALKLNVENDTSSQPKVQPKKSTKK
jgi:hypothetical protein